MCTVTYIPLSHDAFILTSNRDETPMRKTIPPQTYAEEGVQITYPKDQLAGGTWIGVSSKNRVICLLNGAFEKHKRKSSYRLSRGVVVKKLLTCDDVLAAIHDFNFIDIEPFTLVSVDWSDGRKATEFVWDGQQKHIKELGDESYIWSSSPLYDSHMREERHSWFYNFIASHPNISQKDAIAFHQSEQKNDRKNSILMKRLFVETVSTTSIYKTKNEIELFYIDYLKASKTKQMKLRIPQ